VTAETTAQVTVNLSPAASKRLVEVIGERRLAYGWTRGRLAEKANATLRGTGPLTENLLDTWAYKLRTGQPMRVELEKALALLAAFGYASNRLDELAAGPGRRGVLAAGRGRFRGDGRCCMTRPLVSASDARLLAAVAAMFDAADPVPDSVIGKRHGRRSTCARGPSGSRGRPRSSADASPRPPTARSPADRSPSTTGRSRRTAAARS